MDTKGGETKMKGRISKDLHLREVAVRMEAGMMNGRMTMMVVRVMKRRVGVSGCGGGRRGRGRRR